SLVCLLAVFIRLVLGGASGRLPFGDGSAVEPGPGRRGLRRTGLRSSIRRGVLGIGLGRLPVSDSSVSVSADSACEASSLWLRLRSAIEPPACLRFFFPLDVADEAVDSAAVVDSAWESSEDSPALRRRAFSRRLASGDFALSGPL